MCKLFPNLIIIFQKKDSRIKHNELIPANSVFGVSFFHRILLHDLAAFVDGEGALAGGEGDAAEVAAGAFAGGFCPAEGFFRVVEVVGGEHCGGKVRRNVDGFCQGRLKILIFFGPQVCGTRIGPTAPRGHGC